MKKNDITILSVILASPLIIGIIIAGIFKFDLTKGEWITLVTSCVSTFAAIFLGFMVFFQNENHKKRSEEMAKEHERQEIIFRDEQHRNREQDIMIKANPVVYLQGINRFDFNLIGVCGLNNESVGNILLVEDKDADISKNNCYFSFDIVFKNDFGKMVDYITIKSARLTCEKGDFTDDGYKSYFRKTFNKINLQPSIIRLGGNHECIALLQLFLTGFDNENIKFWLNDETLRWTLTFKYIMSNSCEVKSEFESQIIFMIEPNPSETPMAIVCKTDIKQIDTWQRSAVTISKEKANELNA